MRGPDQPAVSAALSALAAARFASDGKSSLPRKSTRVFLKTSGQNGSVGSGARVA